MKKTIIIPDVHNRIDRVKTILAAHGQNSRVIWLGDWFDSFEETKTSHIETAKFLRRRMDAHPDDEFILGNHDCHYITSLVKVRCSGFTVQKYNDLVYLLPEPYATRFKVTHNEQGIIFSHAGITPLFIGECPQFLGTDAAQYNKRFIETLHNFDQTTHEQLVYIGKRRGGYDRYPGPMWTDFDYEFSHIPGVSQVFGHTPQSEPKLITSGDNSFSLNLDTHTKHFAILEDGKLTVYSVKDPKVGILTHDGWN